MKTIILALVMTASASAFAMDRSRGSCDRYPNEAGCEKYSYKGPWIDAGVSKKCWKTGNGHPGAVICGMVRQYVNFGAANIGPKDLNGDGKISAYERMVFQQQLNESGK